jgi:hypothetical protein
MQTDRHGKATRRIFIYVANAPTKRTQKTVYFRRAVQQPINHPQLRTNNIVDENLGKPSQVERWNKKTCKRTKSVCSVSHIHRKGEIVPVLN